MPSQGLSEIYEDNVWRLYAFFAYRVGSAHEAEDLTQAVFERAVRAFDRYDPARASPSTWLMSIASNLLIDNHRRRAIRPFDSVEPEVLERVGGRNDPFADLGVDPALARGLESLTQRDREIVALRYGADLTGPEIAELTGESLANVQQIISRSLRKLRSHLNADEEFVTRDPAEARE